MNSSVQEIDSKDFASNRSRSYIDQLAEKIAAKLLIKPGVDLDSIVSNQLGGKIQYQNTTNPELDGSLVVEGEGNFTIFLSPYIGRLRNRFTVAHELGHYFLHSEMGNKPFRIHNEGEGRGEWEADWFAIGLLMPEKEFREAIESGNSDEEVAAQFDVSTHLARTRRESLGL